MFVYVQEMRFRLSDYHVRVRLSVCECYIELSEPKPSFFNETVVLGIMPRSYIQSRKARP